MAFRAPPSFCADAAYQKFLSLRGFSPAKESCSNLAVHQGSNKLAANINSVELASHAAEWRESQCPAGSSLCTLLSELQAADSTFARNVCRCIGVYVVIPGNGISKQLATEITTGPMSGHTSEPVTRPSSKDADTPITEALLRTTLSTESSRTTFIESRITTSSEEWDTTSLSSASVPPNLVTVLVALSTFPTTIYSTSTSILSGLSRSSSTSTRLSSPGTAESISSSSSSSILPSSTCSSCSTTFATSASTLVVTSISLSCSSTCSSSSFSSSSSSSSSSTASLRFSTCTYPTATTTCPTVTAAGLAYKEYYAGQYHTENTLNPGTGGEPAIYTRFRRTYDMCAAAQYCANAAGAAYGPYHSFDLHYTCSNSSWICVQYFNGNRDTSYFNVLNLDVVIAFGYSY